MDGASSTLLHMGGVQHRRKTKTYDRSNYDSCGYHTTKCPPPKLESAEIPINHNGILTFSNKKGPDCSHIRSPSQSQDCTLSLPLAPPRLLSYAHCYSDTLALFDFFCDFGWDPRDESGQKFYKFIWASNQIYTILCAFSTWVTPSFSKLSTLVQCFECIGSRI